MDDLDSDCLYCDCDCGCECNCRCCSGDIFLCDDCPDISCCGCLDGDESPPSPRTMQYGSKKTSEPKKKFKRNFWNRKDKKKKKKPVYQYAGGNHNNCKCKRNQPTMSKEKGSASSASLEVHPLTEQFELPINKRLQK